MRARSARPGALGGVVAIALVGLLVLLSSPRGDASGAASPDSTPLSDLSFPIPIDEPRHVFPPPPPYERTRALLAAARDSADKWPRQEWRWETLARVALEGAPSQREPGREDPKEIVEALREAGKHLPASALAGLSADGNHPELSLAYVRAIGSEPPRGVPVQAEIAAEARDAVARFGYGPSRKILEATRRDAVAVDAAGGAQRTVYSVALLMTMDDASAQDFQFGFQDGLRAAYRGWETEVPQWGGYPVRLDPSLRFRVRNFLVREEPGWTAAGVAAAVDGHPGLIVVVTGDELVPVAATAARETGAIFIDARAASADDRLAWGSDFARFQGPDGMTTSFQAPFPFDGSLRYTATRPNTSSLAPGTLPRAYSMRPPGTERARRLGEALQARAPQGDVAVAIPREGGDRALLRGLEMVAQVLGRRLHPLFYEPGRRDYAPEVRRFVDSGAKALVLAGPAEESVEWALALQRARVKPVLFGSAELAPDGFHASARPAIEGAIYVADEWEGRDSTLTARGADASDVRGRGLHLGERIGREVRTGAFTPASLALALATRSLPVHRPDPSDPLALGEPIDEASGKPSRAIVPLYEVKSGRAVQLELR